MSDLHPNPCDNDACQRGDCVAARHRHRPAIDIDALEAAHAEKLIASIRGALAAEKAESASPPDLCSHIGCVAPPSSHHHHVRHRRIDPDPCHCW